MATAPDKADFQVSAASAPILDRASPAPGGWIERLVGRSRPATRTRLSVDVLVRLFGLFIIWRFGILLVSLGWGQLPIMTHWPPEIDVMWLWRYSVRWDSGWYLSIASGGYQYHPDYPSSVAFFPLFPLLIRGVDAVLPGSNVLAALVVVHLALAAALVYIYKLLQIDYGDRVAWRSIYFLLIFPGAFFLSAVYSESLLLLAIAGSLYHARRGQWLLAALFGIMGSATKLIGVALIIPLGIELASQRGRSLRSLAAGAWILLTPLGALAYFAYLQARFGNFRVFFDTEEHWYREPFSPVLFTGFQKVLDGVQTFPYYPANTAPLHQWFVVFDTTLIWLFLAAGVVLWLRHRPAYGALVIVFTLIPALSGNPQSMNRYLAILFPVFLLLGRIRSEPLRNTISVASVIGLTFTTYLFVNGLWAG